MGADQRANINKVAFLVLNAFRHQRWVQCRRCSRDPDNDMCSTPFGIRDGCSGWIDICLAAELACSTPFGIRDGCSLTCNNTARSSEVLNAFRHQRWVQSNLDSKSYFLACAQRLSASEMGAEDLFTVFSPWFYVLNAFRHQRWVQFRLLF